MKCKLCYQSMSENEYNYFFLNAYKVLILLKIVSYATAGGLSSIIFDIKRTFRMKTKIPLNKEKLFLCFCLNKVLKSQEINAISIESLEILIRNKSIKNNSKNHETLEETSVYSKYRVKTCLY